jgi:hypothetical protein
VANRAGTHGVYQRCGKVSLLGLTRLFPIGPVISIVG